MAHSTDPNALSHAQQGQLAASLRNVPGAMPLERLRARLTGDNGGTPKSFTWSELEMAFDGSIAVNGDGLTGDASYNPAREQNGLTPPSYPWDVWLEPRGSVGSLGVVWEFSLGQTGAAPAAGSGAEVGKSVDQVLPSAAFGTTWTALTFDTVITDAASYFVAPSTFRVPSTGLYTVSAAAFISVSPITVAYSMAVGLRLLWRTNRTAGNAHDIDLTVSSRSAIHAYISVSATMYLAATETVQCQAIHDNGFDPVLVSGSTAYRTFFAIAQVTTL